MPCDVLNLEWSSTGRDREVATLICQALRRQGLTVIEDSVFNYRQLLLEHRPRLLYLADPAGARINFEAALYAERLGVPCVSFEAEGNYAQVSTEEIFWGHVEDRDLHQRMKLQWSTRSRDAVLAIAPHLRDRLKVTGAVGFDRYRLVRFAEQEEWRRRYGFRQARVVGYASWGFDHLYREDIARHTRLYDRETLDRFRGDRDAVRTLLGELVDAHPETLFVLKEHPATTDLAESEIAGLDSRPNTLRVKHEETIGDCINVCDVWMAYDSTTCIEAWLLDTPTLFINPSGPDFPRSDVYRGNPIMTSLAEVDGALRAHADSGQLPGFESHRAERDEVLRQTLQWTDGKNHLRAAHYMNAVLGEHAPRPSVSLADRLRARKQSLLFNGARYLPRLPGFASYASARRRFDDAEIRARRRLAAEAIEGLPVTLSDDEVAELEAINS